MRRSTGSEPAACCATPATTRGVVTLTLNRPQAFNALSRRHARCAAGRARRASRDDERARVLVILAAAGKAFCAGHDLKEMRAEPSQAYYERAVRAMRAHDAERSSACRCR